MSAAGIDVDSRMLEASTSFASSITEVLQQQQHTPPPHSASLQHAESTSTSSSVVQPPPAKKARRKTVSSSKASSSTAMQPSQFVSDAVADTSMHLVADSKAAPGLAVPAEAQQDNVIQLSEQQEDGSDQLPLDELPLAELPLDKLYDLTWGDQDFEFLDEATPPPSSATTSSSLPPLPASADRASHIPPTQEYNTGGQHSNFPWITQDDEASFLDQLRLPRGNSMRSRQGSKGRGGSSPQTRQFSGESAAWGNADGNKRPGKGWSQGKSWGAHDPRLSTGDEGGFLDGQGFHEQYMPAQYGPAQRQPHDADSGKAGGYVQDVCSTPSDAWIERGGQGGNADADFDNELMSMGGFGTASYDDEDADQVAFIEDDDSSLLLNQYGADRARHPAASSSGYQRSHNPQQQQRQAPPQWQQDNELAGAVDNDAFDEQDMFDQGSMYDEYQQQAGLQQWQPPMRNNARYQQRDGGQWGDYQESNNSPVSQWASMQDSWGNSPGNGSTNQWAFNEDNWDMRTPKAFAWQSPRRKPDMVGMLKDYQQRIRASGSYQELLQLVEEGQEYMTGLHVGRYALAGAHWPVE